MRGLYYNTPNSAGENATKERIAKMFADRKKYAGGIGGKGGEGVREDGGKEHFWPIWNLEAVGKVRKLRSQVTPPFELIETLQYHDIMGGIGGEGGKGDRNGGDGGAGRGHHLEMSLVPPVDGEVPYLTIPEFCKQYHLSNIICDLLENKGFGSAEDLFEATDFNLVEAGLQVGHIAAVRRALKKFAAQAKW
ncbi:hypothetical protein B0H19DRAFT_1225952 [Mycena capillaripes]|nr:hypothetical protein B0H19DRAFT_1225952 [Mycena capillaripes]